MASARQRRLFTLAEYLQLERTSSTKSEFVSGEIYATTGGSVAHSRIAANIIIALGKRVSAPCGVFESNLRIYADAAQLATNPDALVICGEPTVLSNELKDTVTNPTGVFEVLSPSNEAYDRGAKFQAYKTIASLRHYVLVAQEAPVVEVFTRDRAAWPCAVFQGLDARATLPALSVELPLSEVFAGVSFTE